MPSECPPTIDPVAAARWARIPAAQSPWLHEEVGSRMAQRLQWIKSAPSAWAHWGPMQGGWNVHEQVMACYPASEVFLVEAPIKPTHDAIKKLAKPWWNPASWGAPRLHWSEPPDAAVQMVWANMLLHMAADPAALIARWQRALAVDGFLMFSCFGPDTLGELRDLYGRQGWPPPAHEYTDMHDWGDMLVAAGFAEPVMDMERITLSFATPERLLLELRGLGRNLHSGRHPRLRGRLWRDQLHQILQQGLAVPTEGAPLQLTFEINYGHAFKPQSRLKVQPETRVSLESMRQNLLRGKVQKR